MFGPQLFMITTTSYITTTIVTFMATFAFSITITLPTAIINSTTICITSTNGRLIGLQVPTTTTTATTFTHTTVATVTTTSICITIRNSTATTCGTVGVFIRIRTTDTKPAIATLALMSQFVIRVSNRTTNHATMFDMCVLSMIRVLMFDIKHMMIATCVVFRIHNHAWLNYLCLYSHDYHFD